VVWDGGMVRRMRLTSKNNPDPPPTSREVVHELMLSYSCIALGCAVLYLLYRGASCVA
jgi:hypothetical protein